MKGIMFLDDNFKPVKLPSVDRDAWIEFTEKARYGFFNIPERMNWFKSSYQGLDEINSIFLKTKMGVYTYSEEDEYWHHERDKSIFDKVQSIYFAYNEQYKENE